ncbi:hypothetical protein [Thermoanaerobacterium sp. RBIITD]|uniref:hypothetical protein n=1 Tax=Thermoanaerobacterium sp. RBIITD TaxID=1550240 RepID=UPI000BC018D4|nr:hypothetical protein [Thermoanaerobacterium sp. RBIITD]SNX54213.1 hypothetical protein SAMN05660242_1849 [Thermoanaerobacterium sp. RBIITD]
MKKLTHKNNFKDNNKRIKNNKHKNKPTPIIQYSELGLPVISSRIKTLRQMYEEDKWS